MLEGLGQLRPSYEDIKLLADFPLLRTYLQFFDEPYYSNSESWVEDLDNATRPLKERISVKSGERVLDTVKYQTWMNLAYLGVLDRSCPEWLQLDHAEYLTLIGYEVKPFTKITPFNAAIQYVFAQPPLMRQNLAFEEFKSATLIISTALGTGTILRMFEEGESDQDNLKLFREFINGKDFGQTQG